MRLRWALVAGLVIGIALAWWSAREPRSSRLAKQQRAERAAAAMAEDAKPVLYRWRDRDGVLQVTRDKPVGRRYERIPVASGAAIEVRGDRR